MTLPSLSVGGLALTAIETPPGLACWQGEIEVGAADPVPVSLVIDPAGVPAPSVLALVAAITGDFTAYDRAAVGFLRARLTDPAYGLSPEELADLAGDPPPLDQPEVTVWSDETFMIRYPTGRLRLLGELGLGVEFHDRRPTEILVLDESDA